jgi:FkbM family methyltransferase
MKKIDNMVYTFTHLGKNIALELHDKGSIGPLFVGPSKSYYELEMLEHLRLTYPRHKTIVDAGAHCGNHVVYYANHLQHTRILGFEPLAESYDLLVKNTKPYPSIEVFNFALSDSNGRAQMVRFAEEPGCTLFRRIEDEVECEDTMECKTIDSLNLTDVTLMKLDSEGEEWATIQGAQATIERDLPVMIVELSSFGNSHNDPQVTNPAVIDYLLSLGYTRGQQWYDHVCYEFIPPNPERFQ